MLTIRQGPRPENRFTLIANDLFRRSDISMNAKGIYGFIRSFSDGWELSVKAIADALGISESTVKRAIRDLERAGYLRREQRQDERGRFAHVQYTILAEPEDPSPQVTDGQNAIHTVGHQRPSGVTSENCESAQVNTVGHQRPSGVTSSDDKNTQVEGHSHRGSLVTPYKKNKEKQEEHNPHHPPTGSDGPLQIEQVEILPAMTPPATPPSRSGVKGTRLPEGWMPAERTIAQIRSEFPGIPDRLLHQEHLKFSDYWTGVAGQRGRKCDWEATWRNWIRRAMERHPGGFSTPPTGRQATKGVDGKAAGWVDLLAMMRERGEFQAGEAS